MPTKDRTSECVSQFSEKVSKKQEIESDNSLDYNELRKSLESERYNSSRDSKNSISFNNISTIMKKNPNITIKTVIEHYNDLTNQDMPRLD